MILTNVIDNSRKEPEINPHAKIDTYNGVTFDDISATQPAESPFEIDSAVNGMKQVSHVILPYDDERHLTSSTDSLPHTDMYNRPSIVNSSLSIGRGSKNNEELTIYY